MDDIFLKKVVQSIRRINERGYHISKDPLDFLRKNRLLRDGKLTFAAEMLFAKDWHVNTAVQMGFFQSPTIIKDRGEAQGDCEPFQYAGGDRKIWLRYQPCY